MENYSTFFNCERNIASKVAQLSELHQKAHEIFTKKEQIKDMQTEIRNMYSTMAKLVHEIDEQIVDTRDNLKKLDVEMKTLEHSITNHQKEIK